MNLHDLKIGLMKGAKRLSAIHPNLNVFQINKLLAVEYEKRTGSELVNYKDAVHGIRENGNYFCYNGSPHLKTTTDLSRINCVKCLKEM